MNDIRRNLEARLARPDPGENRFTGDRPPGRLDALRELVTFVETGDITIEVRRGGINTHVHTAKSFSYFESPSQAVWQALLAGIEVFGINDHYTLAGHEEFREACAVAGIHPTFSMEAIAMWDEAEASGETVNDPSNPGRAYLTAKGVSRSFSPECQGQRDLDTMNRTLLERNRRITDKLSGVIEDRLGARDGIGFEDVLSLTPHGQPTERHVAAALAGFLETAYPDVDERQRAVERLTNHEVTPETLVDSALLQNHLRGQLIKAGRPAFVEESREAFISIERMVGLSLDLGAIPTYPVLGNPVTPWEEDLDRLFDRFDALRIRAIEVIPDRNTRERLLDIVHVAAQRHLPVFNGTEHNTKSPAPLVDRFFFDDDFRPHFERGANLLLGHQMLRSRGDDGFISDDGSVPGGDRQRRLEEVEALGASLRVGSCQS